jgi:hypothetical protein
MTVNGVFYSIGSLPKQVIQQNEKKQQSEEKAEALRNAKARQLLQLCSAETARWKFSKVSFLFNLLYTI